MSVKYLLLIVAAFAVLSVAIGFGQANHFSICSPGCNTTVVWWNETVNVTGTASADQSVTARIDGTTVCQTNTGGGGWNCTFDAPREAGDYNLSVTVGSTTDDSTLTVRPIYGFEPIGTISRFVIEVPSAIQEPSGGVNTVVSRLTVSRGILT